MDNTKHDLSVRYERLKTEITLLSVESPPEDLPISGRCADAYDRGRRETWSFFETALLEILKADQEATDAS